MVVLDMVLERLDDVSWMILNMVGFKKEDVVRVDWKGKKVKLWMKDGRISNVEVK
jgi:hypothetical protein